MKCIFRRWCFRKVENCALYWEGRQDQAIITAMIPIVEVLDEYTTTPEGERAFAAIHRWANSVDMLDSWHDFGITVAHRLR